MKIRITDVEEKRKLTMRYSIWDGSFYSVMVGLGESFFSAFAVFLKANNLQIALISALPQALGAFAQLYATRIMGILGSRKRMILTFAILEGIMLIPIMLAFFLGAFRVYYLLLFVVAYYLVRMLVNPAWTSLIGDIVPQNERGSYFGKRNTIAGFASLAALLLGGFILQFFTGTLEFVGFAVIFSLAFLARMVSISFLARHYEIPLPVMAGPQFSFIEFVRRARFNNYGLFVIFLCCMNFSVYIAAPFFTVYILRDLKFDYWLFTIIIASAMVSKFASMRPWGMVADRFGSRKVLTFTGLLISIVPVLWLFSTNVYYLIAIQLFSGLVWAGFELSAFNFVFDSTSSQKRATAVAYYNLLNGMAILAGAVLGGLIVRYNNVFWSKFYLVFLLSFGLRFIVALFFARRIHEVRTVEKSTYTDLIAYFALRTHATALHQRAVVFPMNSLMHRKPPR